MVKAYSRINWENSPSEATPINEDNLNRIDAGLDETDNRIITLDTTKLDKVDAQMLVKQISYNQANGVFTITYFNGTTFTIDTVLEKLAVNFDFDPIEQRLIIVLDDGTEKYVDLSALLTQYEFQDSDTITFVILEDGKVFAKVKEGVIEEKHLRPNYLADVKVEVAKAEARAGAALDSQHAAKQSEDNALASANVSADSAQDSADSAAAALESEQNSRESEEAALEHKNAAKLSEDNSSESAISAAGSAQAAAGSAADAKASEDSAEASSVQAEDFSLISKSYAVGTEGEVRPGDATDNSKFYSDLAQYLTDESAKLLDQAQKLISAATQGAIIPSGTVAFENLPKEPKVGYMYNVSNSFVTDDRFAEGPGIQYNPGANVYWTREGQWDVMIGVQVTGVKGAAESFYRQGNVDITPANIGLGNVPNVGTNDQAPTFTQASTRENIASGNKLSVIFGKIMKWYADLKEVAFSGSYNDLSNKPDIPPDVAVKGNSETSYRTGNVNLTAENVGAVPLFNEFVIGGNTDWNTILSAGSHLVQTGKDVLDGLRNSPIDMYGFGILYVIVGRIDNNFNRITQIYIPHVIRNGYMMAIRMIDESTWTPWRMIKTIDSNDLTYVHKSGDTVTGKLLVKGNGLGIHAVSNNETNAIGLGIHSGGVIRGLFDNTLNKYFFYLDGNNSLQIEPRVNITERTWFRRSTAQGIYSGTSGTAGWVVIAQIEITGTYINYTLEFEVGGRDRALSTTLFILFNSVNNTDPTLNQFCYYGGDGSVFRLKKTATSTWQLAAQKNESYGRIDVFRVHSGMEMSSNAVKITYPGTMLSSTPDSDWKSPVLSGKIKTADVANLIGTDTVGNENTPIYLSGGRPVPIENKITLPYNYNAGAVIFGIEGESYPRVVMKLKNESTIFYYDIPSEILTVGNLDPKVSHALVVLYGSEIECRNENGYSSIVASDFNKISSLKYKENIKNIEPEEARKILSVRIVSYDYKEEYGGRKNNLGAIAEELYELIPSMVSCRDGEPDSVDYSMATPYLIKMIQIQQKEINELKNEVGELRRENESSRLRLENLESQMEKVLTTLAINWYKSSKKL